MRRLFATDSKFVRPIEFALVGGAVLFGTQSQAADTTDELAARYYVCSGRAVAQLMDPEDAQDCARTYLLLKLSLVPGVTIEDYRDLPPEVRARVNQAAYEALKAWREAPDRNISTN